ncbi:hypothetical protein ACFPOG_12620 [Paenibacillus aestuarii]|uniref:Uncharacterized protein n=1 Tax=Paenibacillus aestuarii TaxID=516965 RepID=A0ABW0K8K2_9BACL
MDKLVLGIIITIILIGSAFWLFNNDNGVGKGLDQGGQNVKAKIIEATN